MIMAANIPPTNPLKMENDLKSIAKGIEKNPSVWPPEAPPKTLVIEVANEIRNARNQVELCMTALIYSRRALRELMKGRAREIYRTCRGTVQNLLHGKENEFGMTGRKKAEKRPIPEVPTGLIIGTITNTTLEISWHPVRYATCYKIYIGFDPIVTQMTAFQIATRSSITLTSLQEMTKYYFSVKAVNASGESDFSNVAESRTM
jgi:hypothetical protein